MGIITSKKLTDSILDHIRNMVETGELREGDKLPNQYEFAAQLGVSRPSLREALYTLKQVGAIEQRPGSGTVLRSGAATLSLLPARSPLPVGRRGDHRTVGDAVYPGGRGHRVRSEKGYGGGLGSY